MSTIEIENYISENLSKISPELKTADPIIISENLGVKYIIGHKRENLQSRMFNLLLRKNKNKYFWALKGVSFTGYAGDIIGVIGSNGAGKSTLCRMIAGLLKPDMGSIRVNGNVSALLSLGTGFNTQLSGRENIYLNAMMLGFSKKNIDMIYKEIQEFSGLGHFIDEPLKNYSSGMRARLAFSVGAMIKPDILILDEALSAGDIEFSEKAGKKLHQIIQKSKIVIVVTHNLGFVEKYCSTALWIEKGSLQTVGRPVEVVKQYRDSVSKRAGTPRKIKFARPSVAHPSVEPGIRDVVNVNNIGVKFKLHKKKSSKNNGSTREFWPLKNINFSVKKGEVVGIIGRNGEGKTTLCRILTGILKPDRGNVFVDGKTTALLTFGAGFNMQLTGRDNIFLNGLMLGISKKKLKQVMNDIIEFSELETYIDQPVKKYSNGMRSRLGFSIAAMIKPDIFIIDEALNAGDISFYAKASVKIQELLEEAKAVIVVTHSMSFVSQVCTRGLWLENGIIQHDGPAKETVAIYEAAVKKGSSFV